MSTPTNHWKLGLFVVVAVLLGLSAIAMVGARSMPKEAVTYSSFFDEAVTGLEVGSPVKFRGVTIGNVSRIELGPDHRHVKVSYDFTVATLNQLGMASTRSGEKTRMPLAPNVRAQLNATGITGIKYVQLDYFDDVTMHVTELPFPVGDRYIPTQPSSMKGIEASVVQTADRLPEVTERILAVLERAQRVAAQVEDQNLPKQVGAVLAHADQTLTLLDSKLSQVDTRELSQQTRATLVGLQGTTSRVNGILDRVGSEQGLLTSAQHASDALGEAVHNADGLSSELASTLQDVSEAAAAIRGLADALERQPDMLLKGRGRAQR